MYSLIEADAYTGPQILVQATYLRPNGVSPASHLGVGRPRCDM